MTRSGTNRTILSSSIVDERLSNLYNVRYRQVANPSDIFIISKRETINDASSHWELFNYCIQIL